MIVRNSLRVLWRTRLKSTVFLLIVLVLTVVLGLGVSLWASCASLLSQAQQQYTTTAVLEYRGAEFPNEAVYDPQAVRLYGQVDWQALAEATGVLEVQPGAAALGFIEGYQNKKKDMPQAKKGVLSVMITSVDEANNRYGCVISQALYSNVGKTGGMAFLSFEDGFVPQYRHKYLVCGEFYDGSTSLPSLVVEPVLTQQAVQLGVTLEKPYLELPDSGLDETDPAQQVFFEAARAYEVLNGSLRVVQAADPQLLEMISQEEVTLTQGQLYTAQQTAQGQKLCLLPAAVAETLGLTVGDTVALNLICPENTDLFECYWPVAEMQQSAQCTYTLAGLISAASGETLPILVSDLEGNAGFFGYTLGQLHLKNGTGEEAVAQLRTLLPEGVELTVYDQGYGVLYRSLARLQSSAIQLTLAAAAMALAVLTLFAFLFVGRQQLTVETMAQLGTPKRSIRLYLLLNTGIILLGAAGCGSLLCARLSGMLSGVMAQSTAAVEDASLWYSSTAIGTVKTLQAQFQLPVGLLVGCGAAVFGTGMLLCALFLHRVLKKTDPVACKRALEKSSLQKTAVRQEKLPFFKAKQRRNSFSSAKIPECRLNGAGKKYLWLSIRRGGARTLVVPALCLVLTVFLCTLSQSLVEYRARRAALDEETVITGYFTDQKGKSATGLVVDAEIPQQLEESGFFAQVACSKQEPYRLEGVAVKADGTPGVLTPIAVPEGAFAYETFVARMAQQASVVYTNSLAATGEFFGDEQVEISWQPGWNWETFAICEETVCVAPAEWMSQQGIQSGDTVALLVLSPYSRGSALVQRQFTVVGSFDGRAAKNNLYAPFKIALQEIEGKKGHLWEVGPTSLSTVRFTLTDTAQLQQAKNWLAQQGYSRVRATPSGIRQFVVLEDKAYLAQAENLENHITYLETVLPAAYGMMLVLGAAVSYLMVSRRKAELATLRSLGASRGRVFGIFFGEQALLCLAGCVLGAALWLVFSGAAVSTVKSAVVFAAGYLSGTAVSVLVLNHLQLLNILGEKE